MCSFFFTFGHLVSPLQPLDSGRSWQEELESSLKALAHLLRDEKTISAYEVQQRGRDHGLGQHL